MTYTAPTEDDLAGLARAEKIVNDGLLSFEEARGLIDTVESRLSQPAPPPPPPEPALPAVGVVGGSSWNALSATARKDALNLIREAGITHFRVGVPWSSVERVRDQYNLTLYITLVQEITQAGLIPVAVLGYTPAHYRRPGKDMFSAPTPQGVQAFGVYCAKVFEALTAAGCWRYEVWNEPNHAGPPGMNPVSAPIHADLCLEAHAAAVGISRHIRLIAGAISPAPDKPPTAEGSALYIDNTLAHEPDFFDFIDEFSIHPYPGMTATTPKRPNKLTEGWWWKQQYSATRSRVPLHVPISATECGWSAFEMSEQAQAEMIVDGILTWPESGPFYIFNWRDWGTTPARDNRQGLARLDGTLRPAYFAVKNLLT